MHGPGYVMAWIILMLLPLGAIWRRRWWPLSIYMIGFAVFLQAIWRNNGEWDDLADFATLIVIVLPIYLVGSIVWVAMSLYHRHSKKSLK